ncbi:MAG: TRAP transporter large permease [Gemmatimonadaceae bacterium]|nr:TRAP transporter large permease [Acetobacteraceae bacterium]
MVTILVVGFVSLLLLNVPVSFAMGLASLAALLFADLTPALVVQRMTTSVDSFVLLAVPLFLLTGNLMARSGIARDLIAFALALLGRFRGGLAHANVGAAVLMGGVTGSAVADASSLGASLIPPMMRAGYSGALAAAISSCASLITVLIPPSVPAIIFAVVTGVSVTDLLLAGVIPGLLMAVAMMLTTALIARREGLEEGKPTPLRQIGAITRRSAVALMMPLVIIGSIRYGVATPTEAAVVAVMYALLAGLFYYRTIKLRDLPAIFLESTMTTGVVMLMIATANLYGLILTRGQVGVEAANFVTSLTTDKHLVLLAIVALYLLAGTVIDLGAGIIILVPVLFPVTQALGVDPVAFGIITVLALAIGLVTPPVGSSLFICCGIARVPLMAASRAALPYVAALTLVTVAIVFFPEIATWLPQQAKR